jgi:predicted transposase/invertase (TIGR01784 family)
MLVIKNYTRDALNIARYMIELAEKSVIVHKHMESVLEYIIIAKQIYDTESFIESLIPLAGGYQGELMELMDTLQQKGFKRGMERGKHQEALEIARNLLLRKVSINIVQEATGLSLEELTQLVPTSH